MKHLPYKQLRTGGVMRCCGETLFESLVEETEGETVQCKYTDDPLHSLIFRDGSWEWNKQNTKLSDASSD
jgi:hypothetical protein